MNGVRWTMEVVWCDKVSCLRWLMVRMVAGDGEWWLATERMEVDDDDGDDENCKFRMKSDLEEQCFWW
ncbi:hypothetical protein Hanom_Chr17g01532551 [Helianthus anomalus]